MTPIALNFARRPFRDYRPVYLVAGACFLVGSLFFVANLGLYTDFRRQMEGTRKRIAWLEQRQARASRTAEGARAVLNTYKVSALALESRELLRLVKERQFSWTALLARLERTLPPEVRLARLSPSVSETGEILLDLSLVGKGPASVTRTITALSRDPAFHSIELRSETTPELGVPEGHSFQLGIGYGSLEEAARVAVPGSPQPRRAP